MAIVFVQATQNGNAGSSATTRVGTFGSSVTTGNLVVGAVTWGSGTTGDLSSVTDTASNSYTIKRRIADSTNGQSGAVFYAWNVTGGFTAATANFGSSQIYTGITLMEFSGVETGSDPLDGTNEQGQLVTSPGTGTDGLKSGASTQTPGGSNYLVCGFGIDTGATNAGGGSEFAAGTSFTEPANAEHAVGGDISLSSEYWIQTTATAANAAWTVAQNSAHLAFQMIFKVVGGGAPAPYIKVINTRLRPRPFAPGVAR